MKKVLVIGSSLLLAAACATVESDSATASTDAVDESPDAVEEPADDAENMELGDASASTEEDADDPDRVVCRYEPVTGSKFRKRICGTQRQWEEQQRRDQDTTRELQRRGIDLGRDQ